MPVTCAESLFFAEPKVVAAARHFGVGADVFWGIHLDEASSRASLVDLAKLLGHMPKRHEITGKDGGPIALEVIRSDDWRESDN